MSRTVIEIIKRAYRLINVTSIGEVLSAEESNDGLTALNAMLDEWATENLMSFVQILDQITLTPNVSVYTLGATGSIVTVRPESIDGSSYIEHRGVSYPLTIATLDKYNSIALKNDQSNVPYLLWYDATFPNGTLTVYPKPTEAVTLKLWSVKPISYLNLTDVVALPPGYENAITYNLACSLAVEFSMPIANMLGKNAAMAKKKIKRSNYQPIVLNFRSDIPSGSVFNMATGMLE